MYGVGDLTFENCTMIEAGSKSFDVTSGNKGKVTVKNCFSDLAYNPVFGTGPEEAWGASLKSPSSTPRIT